METSENEKITAHRNIYVLDCGHYGITTCSNCGEDAEHEYVKCKKCGAEFVDSDVVSYNDGGSDF